MGFRTTEIDAFLRAAQIDAERRAHAANAAALRTARVSQALEPPYSGTGKGRAGGAQTDGVARYSYEEIAATLAIPIGSIDPRRARRWNDPGSSSTATEL